jgi:fatty acyl-CoA reductase
LDVNVMGVKHLCHFAKQCRSRLNMFMHVSTAFVCGDREGLILEKPIQPGESLREGTYLDVDAELRLVREAKEAMTKLTGEDSPLLDARRMTTTERKAMKELGLRRARHFGWSNTYTFTKAMWEMLLGQQLQEGSDDMPPVVVVRPSVITSVRSDPLPGWMQGTRTIDTLIIGYAEQKLSCFLGDLSVVVDIIPGDMMVNAMMAAMAAHSEENQGAPHVQPPVYHATSSLRNPVTYGVLYESGRRHFYNNLRVGKDGKVIPTREMRLFNTIQRFHLYMMLTFKLPLEVR